MRDLYIIFSSTPYKIGKFIRTFTGEEYNHVSVMFDENMAQAYSCGRRHIDTPFWGGLIKDSVSRYEYKNVKAKINVCKVQVEDEKYEKALVIAQEMYKNKDLYIYNLFAAGISLFKRRLFIENTYTCVEFCVFLLSMMFEKIDKNGFYTVCSLYDEFKECSIYKGEFNIQGDPDEDFTKQKGIKMSFVGTVGTVRELIKRMKQAKA